MSNVQYFIHDVLVAKVGGVEGKIIAAQMLIY